MLLRCLAIVALSLVPLAAQANGRMPGANDLAFHQAQPQRIVARATFGIVQSADLGQSFRWICEQAVDVAGVVQDPPLALTQDGSMVLLPPHGGVLVSHDEGCSWPVSDETLNTKRGTDLTIDPSDPARLILLTSTLVSTDERGLGNYENLLLQTRDNGRTWQTLATLPNDIEAETVEVAKSDALRIYVSGTDRGDPNLGVLLRSEDGGQQWLRSTLVLPAGTGSMFISAIHPRDADKVWLRIAARGDTLGLLPARLFITRDKGSNYQQLAATNKGMFGFALSPDGSELAYGGPIDGFFVGPSDTGPFQKKSALGVRCLRWITDDALYACGSEPNDPFTVGVSRDHGQSFTPLYKLTDTCPAECALGSSFANRCHSVWTQTRTQLSASANMCQAWARSEQEVAQDAGAADAGSTMDAEPPAPPDASAQEEDMTPADHNAGCSCDVQRNTRPFDLRGSVLALLSLALVVRRLRHRPLSPRTT